VCAIQMLDQNKSHPTAGWEMSEQLGEGLEPPSGRTDADDWKEAAQARSRRSGGAALLLSAGGNRVLGLVGTSLVLAHGVLTIPPGSF